MTHYGLEHDEAQLSIRVQMRKTPLNTVLSVVKTVGGRVWVDDHPATWEPNMRAVGAPICFAKGTY